MDIVFAVFLEDWVSQVQSYSKSYPPSTGTADGIIPCLSPAVRHALAILIRSSLSSMTAVGEGDDHPFLRGLSFENSGEGLRTSTVH